MKKILLPIMVLMTATLFTMCDPLERIEAADMTVTLDNSSFVLPYGEEVKGGFSVKDAIGTLSLAAAELPSGIGFRSDAGSGCFYLTSLLKENTTLSARLEWRDDRMTVSKGITVRTTYTEPAPEVDAPESVTLTSSFEFVYPYPEEYEVLVDYVVNGTDAVDEVTATSERLGIRRVSEAEDHKSGTFAVRASQSFGNEDALVVRAVNAGGAAESSVTFRRAYLSVDVASAEATADITKPVEIHINANVPYGFTKKGLDFAEVTLVGNTLVIDMQKNSSLQPRGGEIVIADVNGVLVKTIPVTQKAAVANNDTDRAALMAIYDALNMKEWTEYGAFGTYYSNWGTQAPMDKWLGLNWTDWDGKGRLWQLELMGTQPNSTGYIPEELGNLTELREFSIYPNHKITHLPQSIRNLTKLEEIIFLNDDMEHIDISEWTGLSELMNNPGKKLWSICFAYTRLHGTVPEWVAKLEDKGQFSVEGCHFSGQVPDAVAKSVNWNHKFAFSPDEVECYPRFKDGMFEKIQISEDRYQYSISIGDYNILTQADNYALWVGERPEDTRWVEDSLGGHWEWTD